MAGTLEGEEPVGVRCGAAVVEAEEVAEDPVWELGGLASSDPKSLLVYSTTDHHHHLLHALTLLSAMMTQNTHHPRRRMQGHCSRDATQIEAVSGAAFAAAASAGGVVPEGWREATHQARPRTRRILQPC